MAKNTNSTGYTPWYYPALPKIAARLHAIVLGLVLLAFVTWGIYTHKYETELLIFGCVIALFLWAMLTPLFSDFYRLFVGICWYLIAILVLLRPFALIFTAIQTFSQAEAVVMAIPLFLIGSIALWPELGEID